MKRLSLREKLLAALLIVSTAVVFGVVADVAAFSPNRPHTLLGD